MQKVIDVLQVALPAFNRRRLAWEDMPPLCQALRVRLTVGPYVQDAALVKKTGGPKLLLSERLHPPTWAVFAVVHELAHFLAHPGPREFYLGSPGWMSKTETEANTLALLALWPRPAGPPYPRILQVTPDAALITLNVEVPTPSRHDWGLRWTSRRLTLQRYTDRQLALPI